LRAASCESSSRRASRATSHGMRFFPQQAGNHQAVAAVIALTGDDQHAFLGSAREALDDRLRHRRAGALHEGQTRHAVLFDGQPIHFAHLRGGDNDHGSSSPRRSSRLHLLLRSLPGRDSGRMSFRGPSAKLRLNSAEESAFSYVAAKAHASREFILSPTEGLSTTQKCSATIAAQPRRREVNRDGTLNEAQRLNGASIASDGTIGTLSFLPLSAAPSSPAPPARYRP
jgi:hypothetical protein